MRYQILITAHTDKNGGKQKREQRKCTQEEMLTETNVGLQENRGLTTSAENW